MQAIRREVTNLQFEVHRSFPYAIALTAIATAVLIRSDSKSLNFKIKAQRIEIGISSIMTIFQLYVLSVNPVKVQSDRYQYSMGGDRMFAVCVYTFALALFSAIGLHSINPKLAPSRGNFSANTFFGALTVSYFVLGIRLFQPVFRRHIWVNVFPIININQHQPPVEKPIYIDRQSTSAVFYGGTRVQKTDEEQFQKFRDEMSEALLALSFEGIDLDCLSQGGAERDLVNEKHLKSVLQPLHQVILQFDQRPIAHPNALEKVWPSERPKPPIPSFGVAHLFSYKDTRKCLVLSWEVCQVAVLPKGDDEASLEKIQLSNDNRLLSGKSSVLNGVPIDLPKPLFVEVPKGCYVKISTGHADQNQPKQDLLDAVKGGDFTQTVELNPTFNTKRARG